MRRHSENGTWRLGAVAGFATAAVLVAALLTPLGCADNPSTTVLLPPGGKGGIVGQLTFQGVTDPPFPSADILAIQTDNPDCVSDFGAIALLGTLNNFDTGLAADYLFDEVLPCLWVIEVEFEAGPQEFKFVTGTSPQTIAFDSPPDYGSLRTNDGNDPLEGTADAGAGGPDGNFSVTIPTTGLWTVVLNEATVPATYRITQDPLVIQSDPTDGSFEVLDIPAGSYDVSIQAEGYLAAVRRGVQVKATTVTDLGTVAMEVASGALTGSVAFSDDPDPLPDATVEVLVHGTVAVAQSMKTQSTFSFLGLDSGTYDIHVTAPGYFDETVESIDYVNGQTTDVGPITLDPGCVSEFTTIQIAGDFNQFNLTQAPFMTEGPACVWTDTLTLAAGQYNLKFVTDGAFDNPKDYGGNESETLAIPGTYPARLVSGTGTALKIAVGTAGDYRFVLDEAKLQFSILPVGGEGGEGSILGQVSFDGITEAPFPAATVELRAAGSSDLLGSQVTTSDTRSFRFDLLENGTYEVTAKAACFTTQVKSGVSVAGAEVNVGTIALPSAPSSFTTIQVAGDFNAFNLEQAPQMTQDPGCVWTATINFPAIGVQNIKFVTDGAFDSPPDYGTTSTTTLTPPGTYTITAVTGASGAFRFRLTQAGDYTFILDERLKRVQVLRN